MSAFKPYERYKPSGVEWLGDVPEHWIETKLKFIGELILGLTYSPNDVVNEEGILVLRSSNVQQGQISLNDCVYVSCDVPSNLITTKKDILICSRNGSRSLIGKCAIINDAVIGQTFGAFMTVFRTEYTKFIYYILSSNLFKFQSGRFLTSTINQLTTETLGNFEIPLPPISEQAAIAQYLDQKTALIDALIAKKQQLLNKLAEQRTALISHSVTKGLNPNAPLKASGVEWLGDVPEHWEIMSIKFSLSIPITDGPHETPDILTEGVPFLSAESVKNDKLDFDKKRGYISEEDNNKFSKKYKPEFGDVYMVKSGATTGNVARVQTYETFNIWSPLAAMRPNKNIITTNFLFFSLKSDYFFVAVKTRWSFGTQQNIGMGIISNIKIAVPPLMEQIAITEYLDQKTAKIDQMTTKIKTAISKLTEYRSSLITQAVTGKIDVRNMM